MDLIKILIHSDVWIRIINIRLLYKHTANFEHVQIDCISNRLFISALAVDDLSQLFTFFVIRWSSDARSVGSPR